MCRMPKMREFSVASPGLGDSRSKLVILFGYVSVMQSVAVRVEKCRRSCLLYTKWSKFCEVGGRTGCHGLKAREEGPILKLVITTTLYVPQLPLRRPYCEIIQTRRQLPTGSLVLHQVMRTATPTAKSTTAWSQRETAPAPDVPADLPGAFGGRSEPVTL